MQYFPHKQKNVLGQTSMEFLFVSVIALMAIIGIIAGFAYINNSTLALGLIRSHTLTEIANENQVITLKEIAGPLTTVDGRTFYTVRLHGGTLSGELIQRIQNIESTIQAKTGNPNIAILVERV